MLVFHGTGHVAIEVEAVLEFQQAHQVGRLGDVRFQSRLDQVHQQDVGASLGFGLLAQPGQNRLVNANRQGPEAFDPIDQNGLAEQRLIGTIGIDQRLEPIPLGQTAGVLLLVQEPVGGGPGVLGFLRGLCFLGGLLGGFGLGRLDAFRQHGGRGRRDRRGRVGLGGSGRGLRGGGDGLFLEGEGGSHVGCGAVGLRRSGTANRVDGSSQNSEKSYAKDAKCQVEAIDASSQASRNAEISPILTVLARLA